MHQRLSSQSYIILEVLKLDNSLSALGPSHTSFILPSVDSGKKKLDSIQCLGYLWLATFEFQTY